MNIYEKLQSCRVDLQNMNLKKSGENKFAGYDYFELCDFLPYINKLFKEHKLFSQISFAPELATLTVVDSEKPEDRITFTSPMAAATLKGCHDIQNLGAVESYQRRYLYLAALEIVESDALDKTTGKEEKTIKNDKKDAAKQNKAEPPKNKPALITYEQAKTLQDAAIEKYGDNYAQLFTELTGYKKFGAVPATEYEKALKQIRSDGVA